MNRVEQSTHVIDSRERHRGWSGESYEENCTESNEPRRVSHQRMRQADVVVRTAPNGKVPSPIIPKKWKAFLRWVWCVWGRALHCSKKHAELLAHGCLRVLKEWLKKFISGEDCVLNRYIFFDGRWWNFTGEIRASVGQAKTVRCKDLSITKRHSKRSKL